MIDFVTLLYSLILFTLFNQKYLEVTPPSVFNFAKINNINTSQSPFN